MKKFIDTPFNEIGDETPRMIVDRFVFNQLEQAYYDRMIKSQNDDLAYSFWKQSLENLQRSGKWTVPPKK